MNKSHNEEQDVTKTIIKTAKSSLSDVVPIVATKAPVDI